MRYRDRLDSEALKRYAASLNSRARGIRAEGLVDIDTLRGVILESGGRCGWCDRALMDTDFEVDHILSLHRGGANTPDNLAATCIACNREKGDRHPSRFARHKRAQGSDTALIHRVLADYGGEDAGVQLGLFDDENTPPMPRRPVFLGDADDEDEPEIPPYRW